MTSPHTSSLPFWVRAPALDPARIDEVIFGDANQGGEDNRNVGADGRPARGPADGIPAARSTDCAARLDAAIQASRQIETGDAEIVLVGGVESMSRAPWVLLKPERGFPRGARGAALDHAGLAHGQPEMPDQWTISLGQSAEKLAGLYHVSREAQDEFALRSHQRAHQAWEDGFYDPWVVPVPDTELERDENIDRTPHSRSWPS